MASLVIDIITESAKAVTGLNAVGDAATKQKSKFSRMGGAIATAVSAGGIIAFGKAAVTAATDDAAAQAQLASSLKNTTGATDTQVKASEDYITSLSKQTATADDELRPALATLARATGDQAKAQDLLALSTDIAAGTGKDLETVTNAVAKAQQGNLGPLGKLTGATKDAHGEALTLDQVMANAAKTFEGQAAVAAETTAGKMEGAQIAMGEMSETVGSALLPALGGLADFLADNIAWLGPLAVAIGVVILAMQAWILLTNVGIIPAIGKWIVAQGGLNAALLANPIVLITLAVIALIAIVVLLVKNWDKVVAFLKKAWEGLRRAATAVFSAIGKFIGAVWENIKRVAMAVWNGIKAFFAAYWAALKAIFGTPIAWIKDKVLGIFRDISTTVKTIWNGIKTFFTTLWADIQGIFQGAWDFFSGFMDFLGGLGDDIGDMWEGVTDTLTAAWEGVMTGLKSAVNFFIGGINTLIGGINWVIDKVNSLNPFKDIPHIPLIPKLARGGVLTQPTLFVGGEAGTEIVTPERLLRAILREEGAGRGGGVYTLNMYPRTADAQDVAWGFRRLELARTGR